MSYLPHRSHNKTRPASRATMQRMLDITVSIVILSLISPLLLLIAFAIRIESRGGVIFKQARTGKDGKVFNIYKFRSMRTDIDETHVRQAAQNDPRITRVGAFIRKTSIDELPQFINVLKGDMAIVGPRPHAVEHDAFYSRMIPNYLMRQRVLPGITGLAQSRGQRGETKQVKDMAQRIASDIEYVRGNSLLLDIEILIRTALIVLKMKNAH